MTGAPALLSDPVTMATLHHVHWLLESACRMAADLDVAAAAVLAHVAASAQGVSTRCLSESYGFCPEARGKGVPFPRLIECELAMLTRSAQDRRALALRVTPKGAERSVLADRAMGARIVDAFPGLTEESFDQLVDLFYAYARAVGQGEAAVGLFPAPVLHQLARYWQRVEVIASRFGMTTLQMVALGGVCVERSGLPAGARAERLGLSERFLAVQLEALQDRGLVLEGDALGCTEAGFQRIADFTQRLDAALVEDWEVQTPPARAALGKMLQYVLYLFS